MEIVIVSSSPPLQCGCTTFSRTLQGALRPHVDAVQIVAPPDAGPAGHLHEPHPESSADGRRVAGHVNQSGADMVLIVYEPGMGDDRTRRFLSDLTRNLRVPYCVTLHTVVEQPPHAQAMVIREVCAGAETVFVFTPRARRFLADAKLVDPGKVAAVPHGAPPGLIHPTAGLDIDRRLSALVGQDLYGRRVLSTFGLLTPRKGVERAISAIPTLVELAPDVLYVVAGVTSPVELERSGEAYRRALEDLVESSGVGNNVVFLNRHLDDDEIVTLLKGSQVFVAPYQRRELAVSDTLTFALAAGCAVVSTPFYHAEDLAETGAILLADFEDDRSIARMLGRLLGNPATMASARRAASTVASRLSWDAIGQQLTQHLETAADRGRATA